MQSTIIIVLLYLIVLWWRPMISMSIINVGASYSGNIPHGKLPWPNALHINPYKYLCRWVTEREPSTIMSSSSEYIHLGFIQQTISEEWNDGVSISNLRSNLLSLCIIKDNKIKGSDTTQSFTLLTTVTPFLVII